MIPSVTNDPEPVLIGTAIGSVAVTREGDAEKPPIVCVHGIPGTVRDFRYLGPRLSDHFFVVRVNQPGFGSSPLNGDASVAGWSKALEAVLTALELRPAVVLGHSFGVSAALSLAARRPQSVAGLVILAGPGGRMHRGYGMPHAVFDLVAAWCRVPLMRRFGVAAVRSGFTQRGLEISSDWRLVANMVEVVGSLRFDDLARWAQQITCPVILGHADDDPLVEVEIAREQAGRLSDCECLFWLEGGHHIHKTHADDIAAAVIRRFA